MTAKAADSSGNTQTASTTFTISLPLPPPTPPTTTRTIVMNMPNWDTSTTSGQDIINSVQYSMVVDASYFVARLDASGNLYSQTGPLSYSSLISAAHAQGAKVSLSIGGALQDSSNPDGQPGSAMYSAIVNNPATTASNIAAYINRIGYDGVKMDIEDQNDITADQMVTFFQDLRSALGPSKEILIDVQTYEASSVWSKMSQIEPLIDGVLVMNYDGSEMNSFPSKLAFTQNQMSVWTPMMNGHNYKLFPGVAISGVQYEDYTPTDVKQIAAWAKSSGMGGLMVWNAYYMNSAYWTALNG